MLPDKFETARLTLRPIARGDASAIFTGYAQDPEVVRFVMWRPHRTLAETETYIADCLTATADKSRTYVLIAREGHQLLGSFALRRPELHRLDCGYVLARPHWRRGLMTEALSEVAGWAMRHNLASARVMEKAGLEREGILRRWLVHPNVSGEPRDCFSYALTP